MGYRMERIEGTSRTAYVLYTEQMGYLATLSWFQGHLVYDLHQPEMVNVSARDFEDVARKLDAGQQLDVGPS
jgi:hypothetical protein